MRQPWNSHHARRWRLAPLVCWLNASRTRYRAIKGPACLLYSFGVVFGYFIGWPFRLPVPTYWNYTRYPFPCPANTVTVLRCLSVCQRAVNSFTLFTSKAFGGCLVRCKARTSALYSHIVYVLKPFQVFCSFHLFSLEFANYPPFLSIIRINTLSLCPYPFVRYSQRLAFAPPLLVAAFRGFLLPKSKKNACNYKAFGLIPFPYILHGQRYDFFANYQIN